MIPGAISTKSAAKAPQQCANKVGLITKAADAAKTTKGGIKTVCCKFLINDIIDVSSIKQAIILLTLCSVSSKNGAIQGGFLI